ncbi:MAG: DUF362 domain-containing protein [Candidatus Helarchaeota archaeon]
MFRVLINKVENNQDLYRIVESAIKQIGTFNILEKQVLLKPNCLMKSKNAITNPELIGYIAKWVKNNGGIPIIGDSPMSGGKTAEDIYKRVKYNNKSGFDIIMEIEDSCKWVSFQEGPILISNENYDFQKMKNTVIAKNFVNADVVINIPKWKTHFLTKFTGGVKNYWGVQVGKSKTQAHSYADTPNKFSMVLTDLYSYIRKIDKDNLIIMDAIDIMHGNGGPSYGYMKHLGLILVSNNSVAIDSVAVSIGGLNPFDVPTLKYCHQRELGCADLNQIEVLGEKIEDVKTNLNFPISTIGNTLGFFQPLYTKATKKIPRIKRYKCVKCGTCVNLCPTNSIKLNNITKYPEFNRSTCINCLCCAEGCPEHAIKAHSAGISGILGLI